MKIDHRVSRRPLPSPKSPTLEPEPKPASAVRSRAVERIEQLIVKGARTLAPPAGDRAAYENLPKVRGLEAQRLAVPDLSKAQVFGRPVETSSAHDLFWHYFSDRPAPTTNDEARALMTEVAAKLAPFGFEVTPVEHERMDKVRITGPDGRSEQVDLIYAMGAAPGAQRLQWLPSNDVGPAAPGGAVDETFVLGIFSAFPPTNEGLRAAVEQLKKKPGYQHVRILEHPLRLDKVDFGGGKVVDVIVGSGGPEPRWGWMPE